MTKKRGKIFFLIFPFAICFAAKPSFAYQVKKIIGSVPTPITVSNISSVLGEPRPPLTGKPTRFHGGVDIPYPIGARLAPIQGGTVIACYSQGTVNEGIRIQSAIGTFDYIHIVITESICANNVIKKSAVGDNEIIGTINDQAHLHLQEVRGTDRVNPLRPGALDHTDFDSPAYAETTGVGVLPISLIKEQPGPAEDGAVSDVAALAFPVVNFKSVVFGQVDALVSVRDGSSRKGVYLVGVDVFEVGTMQTFYNERFENIRFDRISDTSPASKIKTLYLTRNQNSDVMFATNQLIDPAGGEAPNNLSASENIWDSTLNRDGPARVLSVVFDRDFHVSADQFLDVIIDNNPPTISNLRPVPNSLTTNTLPFIQADLADPGVGIETSQTSITLQRVSPDAAAISGTQAISPSQAGFDPASPLPGGTYRVTVTAKDRISSVAGHTSIQTWDFQVQAPLNAPDLTPPSAPVVQSPTHPNSAQTYADNNPAFTWTTPSDDSGITGFSWVLDQFATTAADQVSEGLVNQVSFVGVPAGTSFFHIRAQDGAGNWGASAHFQIQIGASTPADTMPPQISGIGTPFVSPTAASIGWTTDEPATSQVEYGLTTAYGSQTALDTALVASHLVALAGLTPSTTYHFRVKSRDASGNLTIAPDNNFVTSPPGQQFTWTVVATASETYTTSVPGGQITTGFTIGSSGAMVSKTFTTNSLAGLRYNVNWTGTSGTLIRWRAGDATGPVISNDSIGGGPGNLPPRCVGAPFCTGFGGGTYTVEFQPSGSGSLSATFTQDVLVTAIKTEPVSALQQGGGQASPGTTFIAPFNITISPPRGGTLSNINATVSTDQPAFDIFLANKIVVGNNISGQVVIDLQGPSAPTNVVAGGTNPSPWNNGRPYLITLTPPSDISGISGMRLKVASPAATNTEPDVLFIPGVNSFLVAPPALVNGSNLAYVWMPTFPPTLGRC